MQSYAIIAALAAIASADVSQYSSYSPYKYSYPTSSSSHTHSQHTHTDPWEECKEEVEALDAEITALEDKCDAQAISIATLEGQTNTLSDQIGPLQTQSTQNAAAIAGLQAADAAQDTLIDHLKSHKDSLSTLTASLNTQVQLLQMQVDMLPNFDDILSRLGALETSNTGLADRITTAEGNITDLETANTTNADNLSTLTTQLGALDTTLGDLNTDVMALEDTINARKIESDYFTVNSAAINLESTASTIGTFCIDADQTVEFFLSALVIPGATDAFVRSISLVDSSGTTVAKDGYSLDPDSTATPVVPNADRPFNLFFKGTTASGLPETYTIVAEDVNSVTGVDVASIAEKNLQWGYRVYSTTYTLEAAPNTSCI